MYSILWDYGVGTALKWVLTTKLSDTENDCMSSLDKIGKSV